MKLAIVGSRSFNSYELLEHEIFNHFKLENINLIISGGAKGADTFAEEFAEKYNIEILVIKPEWEKYGKSAGYKRNIQIVEKSDVVIAFWDGKSKGTNHSRKLAELNGKKLITIYF